MQQNNIDSENLTNMAKIQKKQSAQSVLPDPVMEAILDRLVELVAYQDKRMKVLWANRAACDSAGMTRDELIGRYCYEIWPRRKTPCPDCPVKKAVKTGKPHMHDIYTPDGRVWLIRGYPLKDEAGNIVGGLEITLENTERIRAEDSLKESEEKYRLLFANASEGILTMDMKGKIQDVNSKFSSMTGFPPEELIGKGFIDLARLFQISAKQVASRFAGFVKGRTKQTDWAITTRDGRKIDVTVSPSMIKKGSQNIGISVMITDVTEQKKAQSALKESERFLQNVFDGIQDGICVLDLNYTILKTNAWLERMCEPQMPLVGKKCYQAYHERDSICPWCPSVKAMETGRVWREKIPYPLEEDPKGWIDLSAFPLKDKKGKVVGIIEHVKEISDMIRAEQALKESEEKYRNLIEKSSEAIILFYNNKFEMINNRFTEMFGYTLEELNAPNFDFKKLFAPKSIAFIEDHMRRLENGEIVESMCIFTAVAKSGREIECESSINYIEYEGGKAVQCIIRDITERKRAEERINKDLKENEVLLKEIHHRVKNNLQIISSLLSLQAQQFKNEKALAAFQESRDRIHSMAMVHDKLYRSNDLANVDFKGYIESLTSSLFKTYSTSSKVALDLQIQDIALGIDMAIPCGLLLNELISNSLKHAFPNDRKGRIKILFIERDKNFYKLEFSDNGVGIPQDLDLKEAQTFGFRLINVLVEQLNGELTIQKEKGTTFIITFSSELIE